MWIHEQILSKASRGDLVLVNVFVPALCKIPRKDTQKSDEQSQACCQTGKGQRAHCVCRTLHLQVLVNLPCYDHLGKRGQRSGWPRSLEAMCLPWLLEACFWLEQAGSCRYMLGKRQRATFLVVGFLLTSRELALCCACSIPV